MAVLLIGVAVGVVYSFIAITAMILTARYYLTSGFVRAFSGVLGTITVQLIWILVSVLGIKTIGYHPGGAAESSSVTYPSYLTIFSSLLIFYLAYKVLRAPVPKLGEETKSGNKKAFLALFSVAISVPVRIVGYAALFIAFGASFQTFSSTVPEFELIIGGVLGVSIFWMGYILLLSLVRNKITEQCIYKFSRVGAIILIIMGALPLLSLLRHF
ncbi:MAG: hypothetical protein NTV32_10445 [Gammaproteobacteria bacterium]|nr:hypothetical protein [Gammaproteobacteria bacterium]